MRLALFSDTYLPQINGVSKTLDRLAEYLQQEGISFLFLVPDYGASNEECDCPWLIRVPSKSFPLYPECRVSFPGIYRVTELLDDFKPDLLHLATPFSLGLAGLKYARYKNIPAIASFHTNFVHYLSYYHVHYLQLPLWSFFRWFHNQAVLNLCPSRSTMEELVSHGIPRVGLWSRGVDTDKFSPIYHSEETRRRLGGEDKTLLLYVGRLALEKDLDILWQALRLLNTARQPVRLVVTGEGPLEKQLKASAPPNVTFFGYLHGKKLAEVYASCDIFVFPSTTETLGNVILEAQASGLPVVAPRVGGIKDNLTCGSTGLACKPRNAADLALKIRDLINNEPLRNVLVQGGREYAMQKSWANVMAGLLDNYEAALSNRGILAG